MAPVRIWSHFHGETWEGDVPLSGAADTDAALERIFRLFNRIEQDDEKRLESWGYRLPSLSVGDRVTVDGQTYEVAPVGFEEVK